MKNLLLRSIRGWLVFFIVGLLLCGITAFPLETELNWLLQHYTGEGKLHSWLIHMEQALKITNRRYPQLAYGSDWLAFAHIIIAILFVGPLRDPVRNIWVLQFGCIACVAVFPLAFIAGTVRQIPFFWQLIDCSFGLAGLIPLVICLRKVRKLQLLEGNNSGNATNSRNQL